MLGGLEVSIDSNQGLDISGAKSYGKQRKMTHHRVLFLSTLLGLIVQANGAELEVTTSQSTASTTIQPPTGNITYFSPRVEATQPALIAPSDHGTRMDSEQAIASPATTSTDLIAPVVVTAHSMPSLEVPGGSYVAIPTTQPVQEPPHPDLLPPPDQEMVLSSLEQLLSTATISGSVLAAHFTKSSAIAAVLATATITNSQLAEYIHSVPPYMVGDKTLEAGSMGGVVSGTTYSIAPTSIGGHSSQVVYLNGQPVAETAVPTELSGGDSIADLLSEMSRSETQSGSSTLETSIPVVGSPSSDGVSKGMLTGASTSATGTSVSMSAATTPTMQSDALSLEASRLRLSVLLLSLLLCGLALL